MSSRFDKMIKDFIDTIKENKKTIGPYDTIATVVRVEDDVAFVHIPGGIDETPISKTIDCKPGDEIQIRVGGGRAWIVGNATSPPTDDTVAIKASGVATKFIADLVDGIFVHREGDQKNGVKITDVVDIIRDGFKSATYGEETIFYEPKTNNIAAKIGATGLKIIKGIISLGNKTSANDVTNTGTYIDSNGNMATSNIKAHGGTIGGWDINTESLSREVNGTDIELNTTGLVTQTEIQGNIYRSIFGAGRVQLQDSYGLTEINSTSYVMQGNNGDITLSEGIISADRVSGTAQVEAFAHNGNAYLVAKSGVYQAQLQASTDLVGVVHNGLYWILSSYESTHVTAVHGQEVNLHSTGADRRVRFLANQNGTPVFVPNINNSIYLGTDNLRWAAVYATSVYCTDGAFNGSDLKGKSVINDFDWKIDEFISGLKPIAFKRINEDGSISERIRLGFGAQDVAKLSKELEIGDLRLYDAVIVGEDEKGEKTEKPYHGEEIDDSKLSWSLNYTELIAPMVLEMQRLMNRVDKLENENSQLLHRLEQLEN